VIEEVSRIIVDAIGTGLLELLATVAAREEADAQRPRSLGGEHIPDAIADHEAVSGRK
jgi:hypothetical protein